MASKFMKVKRIVLSVLVAALLASQLTGCSMLSSDELLDLIRSGETIEIEVSVPSWSTLEVAPKSDISWVQLDQLKTYNMGFRLDFDTAFNISTVTSDGVPSKQGCIFVTTFEGKDVHNGNSTMRDAFRNKIFNNYWASPEVKNRLTEIVGDIYTDVDSTGKYALTSSVNAYFNLMADETDTTIYGPTQSLTREQFYALIFRAANGVQELNYFPDSDAFAQAVGGDTPYTMYAKQVAEFGWLNVDNGSLNSSNINGAITKAEAVYMMVNQYFKSELENLQLAKNSTAYGLKNGGNLAEKLKFDKDEKASDAVQNNLLAYMIENPSKGVDESLMGSLVIGEKLNLMNGIDYSDMFGVITKDEAIQLLMNTYQAENNLYGYSTNSETPELTVNIYGNIGTWTIDGADETLPDGPSGQEYVVADSKVDSDASMEEYFQTIYDKYHEIDAEAGKYTESDIYAMECFEINDSVSMKLLPSNGLSLYEAWRLGKYPLPSTDQPQTQTQPQPTDQPTDQPQTSTPTPTAPPVNDSLPKVTEDKNNDAHIAQQQQQQEQAQQQATASGNFTYPPNSTTADLTPDQIAEGLYVRTDKEGKVYNQEGQFQGFRIERYAEEQKVSTDANQAIADADNGSMSDTSNFQ